MSITRDSVSSLVKNIYIYEGDSIASSSVYLEFDESKATEIRHACKNASKSYELGESMRVPSNIKENFCRGFRIEKNAYEFTSTEDLVKRSVYWLRDDWSRGILDVDPNIPRIFIQATDLKQRTTAMPAKNYNKIYEIDGEIYFPVHLLEKHLEEKKDL